jgi:subtilisin family serine protease
MTTLVYLAALCVPVLGAPLAAQAGLPQTSAQPADLGYWNGPDWVALKTDGSRLGLRFEAELDVDQIRGLLQGLPGLASGQADQTAIWIGHTVIVETAVGTSAEAAWQLASDFGQIAGVMSASPRLWAPFEDPYYLTEEILLRWKEGVPTQQRESWTAGLQRTADLSYTVNPGEVYRVPVGENPLTVANQLAQSGLVEFALPDFQLLRVTYSGTDDPLYPNQWHLESTGQNGAGVDQDIDVEGAWDITRGTAGVIIAVIDTGVELLHPDLFDNLVQGVDVLGNDNDPAAEDGTWWIFNWQESHSTAVCGVTGGRGDNAQGTSGVAPRCTVMPIRFLSELFGPTPTVQDEADAFNFACTYGASVINNSWGPAAGATLPASTKAAIDNCTQFGRDGLGSIIFFAAGNSGANNSNNGYASYSGVLGVTAVTDQGVLAGYSSFGASVDCCAPSNGGVNGITTTDRLGNKGYSNGDYTDGFGGTSSASPTAAGVMALILSANPGLTRLEAIEVLLTTAEKVDLANGNYDANGHSTLYGYGRTNAAAAVAEAAARADTVAGASNTIYLNGSTWVQPGDLVQYGFTGAPAATTYFAVWSMGDLGYNLANHIFDVNAQYTLAATGTTDAAGAGSFSSNLPHFVGGMSFMVEVAVDNGGTWTDSNGLLLRVF